MKMKGLKLGCMWALVLSMTMGSAVTVFADPEAAVYETVIEESAEAVEETPEEAVEETAEAAAEEAVEETAEAAAEETVEAAAEETVEAVPEAAETEAAIPDACTVEVEPIMNTTTAEIRLPGLSRIREDNLADSVRITAEMTYNGVVMRRVEKVLSFSEFDEAMSASVDFENYGKFTAEAVFLKDGSEYKRVELGEIHISADAYNISPVSATLPVTFFSLNLWGENNIRDFGPVILMMERPSAYDWDNLPEGCYGLPFVSEDTLRNQSGDFSQAIRDYRSHLQAMSDYVGDLYEMNPNARFHLYCVDYYADIIQLVLYANNIPDGQFAITLMSDGSYTYNRFPNSYDGEDPEAQHAEYVAKWQAARDYARENGTPASGFGIGEAGKYLWAAVDSEPNAEFWVARKDLLKTNGDGNAFGAAVHANPKVVQVSISNLLKNNIQSDETAMAEFKALYNFNDSYFAEAEEQGKDAMVFLGTRVTLEQTFVNYARFVMEYYGDDYVYYYKGHPGTPTDLYPEKVSQLESLGITDVDSSVAAELILFFNPEIYLSGYQSSTYASVPEGMGKGMFNMTKAAGVANPQYVNMDLWMSMADVETADEKIKSLLIEGHENYLVEFSDKLIAGKGYDIAIWDCTIPEIRYYTLENGEYVLFGTEAVETDSRVLPEGTYVIETSLASGKILEVAGGLSRNSANVQLYQENTTDAQKWTLTYDEDDLATFTNVNSGKVLDVAGGMAKSGRNVQQYTSNGTKAQKWKLAKNADDTVTITSALSDAFALSLKDDSSVSKTNVQIDAASGSGGQKFIFHDAEPEITTAGQAEIAEGWYTITSGVEGGGRLSLAGTDMGNHADVTVSSLAENDRQLFYIKKTGDGFYSLTNAKNVRVLAAYAKRFAAQANADLQDEIADSRLDEWKIISHTGGSCTIMNAESGQVLTNAGTTARVRVPNNTTAQQWFISAAASPEDALDALAAANKDVLSDGDYLVRSTLPGNFTLEVAGGRTVNGANVQIYQINFTDAQTWTVRHDEKGYVTFINKKSGKALDVAGASKRNGANVQQYRSNGSAAQKWIVRKNVSGGYEIVSALSRDMVLDISGGMAQNGRNVQLYLANGSKAQNFSFAMLIG